MILQAFTDFKWLKYHKSRQFHHLLEENCEQLEAAGFPGVIIYTTTHMKKLLFTVLLCTVGLPFAGISQMMPTGMNQDGKKHPPKFGVKAGYNISKITGSTPSFNPDNKSGFMVAGFFGASPGVMGFRSEIVFSRQGFSYDANGNQQEVTQDYIYLPQLTTITIARILQLQVGAQLGYLLNAEDTKKNTGTTKPDIMSYYNKLDYGLAGGVEIFPLLGLILGARYNISLGNIYKQQSAGNAVPSPLPFDPSELKSKNAVIQLYAGYGF